MSHPSRQEEHPTEVQVVEDSGHLRAYKEDAIVCNGDSEEETKVGSVVERSVSLPHGGGHDGEAAWEGAEEDGHEEDPERLHRRSVLFAILQQRKGRDDRSDDDTHHKNTPGDLGGFFFSPSEKLESFLLFTFCIQICHRGAPK